MSHFFRTKQFKYAAITFTVVAVFGLLIFHTISVRNNAAIVKDNGVELKDYSGKTVKFNQFLSGVVRKPLVVYFWATWCPYCTAEFADLARLRGEWGDQLQVIAVNRGESLADAKHFTDALPQQSGIQYLLDADDALFKKLGGYAMPETIFINSRGEEVVHKHGPITAEEITVAAKDTAH